MNYFFDAYAILGIIQGNEHYKPFADHIILTNTLHIAEVYYILLRDKGEETAQNVITSLHIEYLSLSQSIVIEAAKFKYIQRKEKLSYADCIGYITAKTHHIPFLTGDQAFAHFENVAFVK